MISPWTRTPGSLDDLLSMAEQRAVLDGVDWDKYEALLALRGERSHPKLTFLDGVIELMSTSREHESLKSVIGCLVEAFCLERDIDFSPYGNWTLKARGKLAGVEPDECYVFGARPQDKGSPDLAIEVVWTHGRIDKLEAYRRLGVGEVWIFRQDELAAHVLGRGGYERSERSAFLPALDLALVGRLARIEPASAAVRQLRAALREPGLPS
ncbi:MAG TPA: Uma2 family endonuclease [Kofleriaceae bacterium]|nr:Uma2 family endonuclease [Kofleriaceae bacterium]